MICKSAYPLIAALFLATWTASVAEPGERLSLHTRRRVEISPGSGVYRVVEETRGWDAKRTAIVICDMWDQHWCKSAAASGSGALANGAVRARSRCGVPL